MVSALHAMLLGPSNQLRCSQQDMQHALYMWKRIWNVYFKPKKTTGSSPLGTPKIWCEDVS